VYCAGDRDVNIEIVRKFWSTLPEDDDHPYRTGPWRPQTTEWDADGLNAVEGQVPRDLDGIYLRNTENPLHPGNCCSSTTARTSRTCTTASSTNTTT
jgi:carotenoid cleavage dioxygenase-like enzyme